MAVVSPLAKWERSCRKIVGNDNWHAIVFERIRGGVQITGAVCPLITVGPKKGRPNYNAADAKTERVIFLPNA